MSLDKEPKDIVITPPEGWEIDKEKSTLDHIVFKKLPVDPFAHLPKRWIDIPHCKGYYVSSEAYINPYSGRLPSNTNRNTWPTEELAKACVALAQLTMLRDIYNDGWIPDWTDISNKYCITITKNIIGTETYSYINKVLAFKSRELRELFMNNFKDLLEIAKPLL